MLAMKEENRLGTMIAASVLLHAMVIIGLKFSPPDLKKLKDNLPALDVILVNAKSQSRPDKADALALTFAHPVGNRDPLDAYRNRAETGEYDPYSKAG